MQCRVNILRILSNRSTDSGIEGSLDGYGTFEFVYSNKMIGTDDRMSCKATFYPNLRWLK